MRPQKKSIMRFAWAALILAFIVGVIAAPLLEAQRRGSFGGSRGGGSFGGARGGGSQPRSGPSPSMAPNRGPAPSSSYSTPSAAPRGSFGGARGNLSVSAPAAATGYRKSYGLPRNSAPVSVPGTTSPYMVHSYGGYSDGLMMGYLMGHSSAMWHTPVHPAFYYSRPTIIQNPDGTVEAYPPRFSFMKLFMTLLVIALVVWLIVWFVRRRRGLSENMSQSSFG